MATAYIADTMNDQQIFIPGIIGAFCRPFSFNLANTTGSVGFIINDTLALAPIPYASGAGGVMVIGYRVNIPSLDTGTSVLCSIGDNNGTTGAFQATYYLTKTFGQNNTAVMDSLCAFAGTTTTPVLPVQTTSNVPRSYTCFTGSATSTPYAFPCVHPKGDDRPEYRDYDRPHHRILADAAVRHPIGQVPERGDGVRRNHANTT